jgi:hypothetical protein
MPAYWYSGKFMARGNLWEHLWPFLSNQVNEKNLSAITEEL